MKTLLSSVLGSGLVALFLYLLEYNKRPKVDIIDETDEFIDDQYGAPPPVRSPKAPRRLEKFLRIWVENRRGVLGLTRNPARGTRCTVQFYTTDGTRACKPDMTARWASLRKPFVYLGLTLRDRSGAMSVVQQVSSELFRESEYIDLYSGQKEGLAVVVKIAGEPDAYGFCNESFLRNHRPPEFRLQEGNYRILVRVDYDSGFAEKWFNLRNGPDFDTFFLEKGTAPKG